MQAYNYILFQKSDNTFGDVSSELYVPNITKISSFFTELFLKNRGVIAFFQMRCSHVTRDVLIVSDISSDL